MRGLAARLIVLAAVGLLVASIAPAVSAATPEGPIQAVCCQRPMGGRDRRQPRHCHGGLRPMPDRGGGRVLV